MYSMFACTKTVQTIHPQRISWSLSAAISNITDKFIDIRHFLGALVRKKTELMYRVNTSKLTVESSYDSQGSNMQVSV